MPFESWVISFNAVDVIEDKQDFCICKIQAILEELLVSFESICDRTEIMVEHSISKCVSQSQEASQLFQNFGFLVYQWAVEVDEIIIRVSDKIDQLMQLKLSAIHNKVLVRDIRETLTLGLVFDFASRYLPSYVHARVIE